MEFNTIEDTVQEIRLGRMVVLVDDEDRENEGDLIIAAEKVTAEAINFMAKEGRGLICLALTPERVEELRLPPMTQENTATLGTAFTVSIGARHGLPTGISGADRAATVLKAIHPNARPEGPSRPGHVFPLKSDRG